MRMLCLAMAFSFHQYTQPLKFALVLDNYQGFCQGNQRFSPICIGNEMAVASFLWKVEAH